MILQSSFILLLSFIFSFSVFALQTAESDYFLISDKAAAQSNSAQFASPQSLIAGSWAQTKDSIYLNLLSWSHIRNSNPQRYEDYERDKHFGPWVNDPKDNNCYNTRAKVLIRDSVAKVTFKGPGNCSVATGAWKDPYTQTTYRSSADVQIDHYVPLKNAYVSGAWKWNFYTRCLYANYMGNSIHLASVQGLANMAKGDKSPERWLPPNQSYRCEYVRNWLIIKLIWNLELSTAESTGIRKILAGYQCPITSYVVSQKDIVNQRQLITTSANACAHLKPK